ncbi:hypothetical protein TTHERM_00467840 (macronuclear) [Tetrahymena thermophila SB210]|uniref:Armadillo-type fold n=1 Tax=Tetrahymena thermophila (strain SB210) TaxID=312017 RepID=I7LXK7_TETTS|nr:hypothetical protein TTHERM_00467840 [Tetrahymena thermophila SB210]EAS04834.2 hypothetical protein TTHERM_00467840 [Tetrahymena thermophila SB210]|eukprot:XP_001025079.2 hypothetical protein TTHERM_00467840 [Tetrahymena thermophila SB210]
MSYLLKRKAQQGAYDYSQINQLENIRKQTKKDEDSALSISQQDLEFIESLPQVSFQTPDIEQNQMFLVQVQYLQDEIENSVRLKNFKNIPRILRKKLIALVKNNSQKKNQDQFQRLMSILSSCLSLQQIANNFFLQKELCDNLFEILNYYEEFVDSDCIDILFNLLSIVESGGIKECLLNIIIQMCKKNMNKCKKSVQENQDNPEINKLSVKMKFKFIKLLFKIISVDVPEQELQSNSKNISILNSESSASKNLQQKPAKSFQSQLIAEMLRWLQQEPLISSKVLKFLLGIESRQATIVKLCLLKNINLNEDSQLYFLDFLQLLFKKNPQSQGDIIHKVFLYINNCTRSLSQQIRLKASQILHYFPYFDENLLLRTIKLEQFQDYGKAGSQTPTNSVMTPSKNDQERFSISHGYGAIVHLLEDEFNEIRKSAIDIIQNFGQQSEQFGKESRDILFYMLNDENDSVRIKAIQGISNVLAQESVEIPDGSNRKLVVITNEEMDSLMFNLKEKVPRLRIVIYKLLGKVKINNIDQLNMILNITLRNINEFGDSSYIFEMCKNVGENNSELIKKNICQILQIADILYVQEPHWKDKAHIYRIIMISNAFKNREELLKNSETLLPSYFLKQYDMMQDLMPKYFHQLYSYEQSQLFPQKQQEDEKKKYYKNQRDIEKQDKEIEEIEEEEQGETKIIKNDNQTEKNNLEKVYADNLLSLLVNSLSEIGKKNSAFQVIQKNAKSQKSVSGPQQDQYQFINKISKIAYQLSLFIKQSQQRISQQQSIQDVQALRYQLLKIIKNIHKVQCKFILDDQSQQVIEKMLFVAILQLPILHMTQINSNNSSTDLFESIKFVKTMTFIKDIIKEFQDANNNKLNNNQHQSASSIRSSNNPFFLLYSCLEEGMKITSDVQANPQRLSIPSTREIFFNRYNNFLKQLPYRLLFPKKESNNYFLQKQSSILQNQLNSNQNNQQIKLRKANIFVPNDEPVEIQSKYMAKTGFIAEITHFLTTEERKNLQIIVEYSDSSYESMQLIEDDFVYLTESIHVINTNIFFQKINWTTESLVSISINYLKPLSLFNRNTIQREIGQLLPSYQNQNNKLIYNILDSSCKLAQSKQFPLIIKSRVI